MNYREKIKNAIACPQFGYNHYGEMKIDIYALLGLVKDGKAPKKIKYKNNIYEYDGETQNYWSPINMIWDFLIGKDIVALLDDEVEIIEESKKIEKCKNYEDFLEIDDYIEHLRNKIDELIEEINNLKENK